MMTLVAAICPTCSKTVQVDAADVELLVCTDEPCLNTFQFSCPMCGPQSRLASPDHTLMLLATGVFVREWRKVPRVTPPLNVDALLDALIDFHTNVDREIEELLGRAA